MVMGEILLTAVQAQFFFSTKITNKSHTNTYNAKNKMDWDKNLLPWTAWRRRKAKEILEHLMLINVPFSLKKTTAFSLFFFSLPNFKCYDMHIYIYIYQVRQK